MRHGGIEFGHISDELYLSNQLTSNILNKLETNNFPRPQGAPAYCAEMRATCCVHGFWRTMHSACLVLMLRLPQKNDALAAQMAARRGGVHAETSICRCSALVDQPVVPESGKSLSSSCELGRHPHITITARSPQAIRWCVKKKREEGEKGHELHQGERRWNSQTMPP